MIGNGLGDLENPGAAFRAVDCGRRAAGRRSATCGSLERAEGVVRGSGLSSRAGG